MIHLYTHAHRHHLMFKDISSSVRLEPKKIVKYFKLKSEFMKRGVKRFLWLVITSPTPTLRPFSTSGPEMPSLEPNMKMNSN